MDGLAILISFFSLGVASVALGWNIYRDVLLRPRARVSYKFGRSHTEQGRTGEFVFLSIVNLGPGQIRLTSIEAQRRPWWDVAGRWRKRYAVIYDYRNPLSARLPLTLDVAESADYPLPWSADGVAAMAITHIGFKDTFGRVHFAPRKDVRAVKEKWIESFDIVADGPASDN